MRKSLFVLITLLVSVWAGWSMRFNAQTAALNTSSTNGRNLFTPASDAQRQAAAILPEQIGTQRTTYVSLNPDALALARASQSMGRVLNDPGIVLNLFDDAVYTATNLYITPRPLRRAGYIWYGRVVGDPLSNVVLVVDDNGQIDLRVLLPGVNYYVTQVGAGVYRVSQINTYEQRGAPDFVDYFPSESEIQAAQTQMNSPRTDDGSLIDILVVYTPKARDLLGGEANIQLAIEGTIALANLTYVNSNVQFQLRLVHTERVNYVEQPFSDITRLTNPNDGHLDQVHPMRDLYKADLVALIPGTSAANRRYCGIANLPITLPAPASGFSVTEALCISDITFAHELGHNMGKAHDPFNAGLAVHPYAYGYQDQADPLGADYGDWVTVMAYSTNGECPEVYQPGVCPAIGWWSNPNQTLNGKPLGTNSQNNTLSLNQTRLTIANYRQSGTVPNQTELLLNGDFEYDADADFIPDAWSVKGSQKTRRCWTNGGGAYSGSCALRISGAANRRTNVAQVPLIGAGALGTGDMLTLATQIKGKAVSAGGVLRAVITYSDDSKETLTIDLPVGDYGYTLLFESLTLSGTVSRIKVQFKYNGVNGRFIADAVSLVATTTSVRDMTIPLP